MLLLTQFSWNNQFHRGCFHSQQMNVGQLNIANLLYILIPHYITALSPIPLYGCFPTINIKTSAYDHPT